MNEDGKYEDRYNSVGSIQKRNADKIYAKGILAETTPYNAYSEHHMQKVRAITGVCSDKEHNIKDQKITELDEPDVRELFKETFDKVIEFYSGKYKEFHAENYNLHSLPSGEVSAFIESDWGESNYNIFIDKELHILCFMISKLFMSCFSDDVKGNGKSKFKKNLESFEFNSTKPILMAKNNLVIRSKIIELFYMASTVGYVARCRPWIPSDGRLIIPANSLYLGMEIFFIAHEISHGHKEHLNNKGMSYHFEYEADECALLSAIEINKKNNKIPLEILIGPYIFLKTIEILEECYVACGREKEYASSTHPTPKMRYENLRRLTIRLYKKEKIRGIRKVEAAYKLIDSIFNEFRKFSVGSMRNSKHPILRKTRYMDHLIDKPNILGLF